MAKATSVLPLFAGVALVASTDAQVINVEIDYMVDTDHTHKPQQAEIDAVVQMFACHGYTLNVFLDDEIPHVDVMRCDIPGGQDFFTCTSMNFTTFRELKLAHADTSTGWHYCIFGHNFDNGSGTGRSGLGEVNGNDFVVTLGSFSPMQQGTPFDRAATFAHELGHNLGLRHFGQNSVVGPFGNFAPNYASVMSYQYQLAGLRTQLQCLGLVSNDHRFKDLDYSSGLLPSLREVLLDEAVGVGIHQIDWNCNMTLDPGLVAQDLDTARPWCGQNTGVQSLLRDYDDWSNIVSSADVPWVADDSIPLETVDCISREEIDALRSARGSAGLLDPTLCLGATSPSVTMEGCATGAMIWVDPNATGVQTGSGDMPYATLQVAIGVAPSQSVLYLQPGTHTNDETPLVIGKPLVLAGPGGAVIDP